MAGFWAKRRQEADERHRKRIMREEMASWVIFGIILIVGYLIYQQIYPLIERLLPMLSQG
jgi:uncharacterized membrane protein YidH (DUF202 family)